MPSATEDTDESPRLKSGTVRKWDSTPAWMQSKKPTLVDEPEGISPLMLAKSKEVDDFDLDSRSRQYNAYLSKRLSGRKSSASSSPSVWHPQVMQIAGSRTESPRQEPGSDQQESRSHHSDRDHGMSAVISEVVAWLHAEKAKKKARRSKRKATVAPAKDSSLDGAARPAVRDTARRASDASDDDSLDLEKLESILEKAIGASHTHGLSSKGSSRNLRRHGSRSSQMLRRYSTYKSSDTECYDDDTLVPSCDVILDNSKTLFDPSAALGTEIESVTTSNDKAWAEFKYEIMRLAHTLKLKGWRNVPLANSGDISVDRLSGALTNAVYVISPPEHMPKTRIERGDRNPSEQQKKRRPLKLILRIYGPHVEHLIDREAELQILRRLARKRIGPRLLGTFTNGRFEEFFNAITLRPQDMRVPETSKQIAKRMRELHDGIELLREERMGGPFVWKNWDKWVIRAETLAKKADMMVQRRMSPSRTSLPTRRLGGFVCGTSWEFFRQMVEKYRAQLNSQYGSPEKLKDQLVFAHNDTQYGNILRLEPPGESPLLLPANEHKQLVVIDFEYANANVPGFEFANHFTEWCYNYHDPTESFKCITAHYPTPEEQCRFIRSYIAHRPQYAPAAPSTPRFTPLHLSRSLSSLNLDGRNPNTKPIEVEETESSSGVQNDSDAVAMEIQRLMHETRIWRVANSAQWVVWGILQARFPENMDDNVQPDIAQDTALSTTGCNSGLSTPSGDHAERFDSPSTDAKPTDADVNSDEFDYLGYARDRAMFFWGDCLQLGLVAPEDLGEQLMKEVKTVPY